MFFIYNASSCCIFSLFSFQKLQGCRKKGNMKNPCNFASSSGMKPMLKHFLLTHLIGFSYGNEEDESLQRDYS